MKKDRKGQYTLQSLVPVAIAFVIIAIVIGIGADILKDIQDDGTKVSNTALNISETLQIGEPVYTTHRDATSSISTITYFMINNATYNVYPTNNGTDDMLVYYSNSTVELVGETSYNGSHDMPNSTYLISYNYDIFGWSQNTTEQGLLSMQTLSEWLPTLALVIVAAIVIGVIVTYFYVRR